MSEYLVILHDAEPPTDQGRASLQQELVAKLGIGEDAVRQMFDNLPVILKENVSRQHAEDFLRILESMGANVEILSAGGTGEVSFDQDANGEGSSGGKPETALMEFNGLSLDDEDESSASGGESLEDLEQMLNSMLGDDGLTADTAPQNTKADDAPDDGAFFVDEEPAAAAASGTELSLGFDDEATDAKQSYDPTADPSLDDLNKLLDEELGALGLGEEALASGEDDDLQNMFNDALASVEQAESEVKAQKAAPALEVSDSADTGLSFDLEGDEGAAEAIDEVPGPESTPAAEAAPDPAAPAAGGMALDLSFEEEEASQAPQESALEAALSDIGGLGTAEEEEDDPFAGLSLPGEGDVEDGGIVQPTHTAKAEKSSEEEQPSADLSGAFARVNVQKPEEENPLAQQVEVSVKSESPTEEVASAEEAPKKKKKAFGKKELLFAVSLGLISLAIVVLLADMIFGSKGQGTSPDAELWAQTLKASLEAQEKRKAAREAAEIQRAAEPVLQRWAGSMSAEDGKRVSIEILSDGNKILAFEFNYEGPQPPEITPEELVEGIDRPWVRKIAAKGLSLAEVVERTTASSKEPQKILIAESPARAYVSDLQGSTRFAGTVRVELALEGAEKLSGAWKVSTEVTPSDKAEEEFHVKRLGPSAFELSLRGTVELTPLRLTTSEESSEGEQKGK